MKQFWKNVSVALALLVLVFAIITIVPLVAWWLVHMNKWLGL